MQDVVKLYSDEARQLDRRYAAAAEAVRQNKDLTNAAKMERLQAIELDRRQAVQALRDEAQNVIADTRQAAQTALNAERKRQAEERRALLGDALYAQLLREELSASSPDEIRQRLASASSPWERQLVLDYGSLELRRRTAGRTPDAAEFGAMQELRQQTPERVRELQQQLQTLDGFDVASLDRRGEAQRIGAVYGVNAAFVPDVAGEDGAE